MKTDLSLGNAVGIFKDRHLCLYMATAALLWFLMFSPWTKGMASFWTLMSISACVLSVIALSEQPWKELKCKKTSASDVALQLGAGTVLAFALWGIFWVGDKASQWMFSFAGGQIDSIYGMKDGSNPVVIALLLLLLIGPAEELFWRGYVQRRVGELCGQDTALVMTCVIYSLVHIWSFNFMLVAAAFVAGAVWGMLYRLRPSLLPALVISHALWDALVFIILPI